MQFPFCVNGMAFPITTLIRVINMRRSQILQRIAYAFLALTMVSVVFIVIGAAIGNLTIAVISLVVMSLAFFIAIVLVMFDE
jgi:DMSO/TMAO reductase YedYZ heme-binding membrane subunit